MTDQERQDLFARAEEARLDGNYEAAQPIYEQLIGDCPDWAEARTGLAHCLLNTGFFDEALAEYRAVVELAPDSVPALMTYGKALCMLGEFDDAKRQFERVLEIDPDNSDALAQMAYFP